MKRDREKPNWIKKSVEKRIAELLELAEKNEHKRANRYAELAWKYATKYRVKIPERYKRRVCRKCRTFLIPGRNLEVRAHKNNKFMTYKCMGCGNIRKYGYRKREKNGVEVGVRRRPAIEWKEA